MWESRTPAGSTVSETHSVQADREKPQERSSLGPSCHQGTDCRTRKREAALLYASAVRPKRRGRRGKASSYRWLSRSKSEWKRKRQRRRIPRLARLEPPRPSKSTSTVLFQLWGGWGEVFNCILVLARHLAESFSSSYSQWQSRHRRIPTSGGRARARRRRGLIRVLVRSYIESSLRWLQTGCLRLSETPVGRSVRLLASRAANEACRTASLDFSGDKRGRLREVLASIVNCIPPSLNCDSLQFSVGPSQWSYDGSASRPEGALRTASARIALPDPACVVSHMDWLPKSIVEAFNSPCGHRQAHCALNTSAYPSVSGEQLCDGWSAANLRSHCRVTPARLSCLVVHSESQRTKNATDSSVIVGLRTVKRLL